jgi:hypothetical protein
MTGLCAPPFQVPQKPGSWIGCLVGVDVDLGDSHLPVDPRQFYLTDESGQKFYGSTDVDINKGQTCSIKNGLVLTGNHDRSRGQKAIVLGLFFQVPANGLRSPYLLVWERTGNMIYGFSENDRGINLADDYRETYLSAHGLSTSVPTATLAARRVCPYP